MGLDPLRIPNLAGLSGAVETRFSEAADRPVLQFLLKSEAGENKQGWREKTTRCQKHQPWGHRPHRSPPQPGPGKWQRHTWGTAPRSHTSDNPENATSAAWPQPGAGQRFLHGHWGHSPAHGDSRPPPPPDPGHLPRQPPPALPPAPRQLGPGIKLTPSKIGGNNGATLGN